MTMHTLENYDHVTWWVSNAKQAATYFCKVYGFTEVAYRGLETGSKDISSRVVAAGSIYMVFSSAIRPVASEEANKALVQQMHRHVAEHGDGIHDVAFRCSNVSGLFQAAVDGGAEAIQDPKVEHDEYGAVVTAIVGAYEDTVHTLVDRSKYTGAFLPGYKAVEGNDKITGEDADAQSVEGYLGPSGLNVLDHCVGNQGWGQMEEVCRFYEKALGFHRFWSVDDSTICTEFSSLRSTVMSCDSEVVKMPINEPAVGKKQSQIEEFVKFYGGCGIQHLALRTDNIIDTITNLRKRGAEFIRVPPSYYLELSERLGKSKVLVKEKFDILQKLDILVDFDENGYLLQLFTKPLSDRPTVFLEIIQRENFDGFGAGNFRALFEAIEREQKLRGTL